MLTIAAFYWRTITGGILAHHHCPIQCYQLHAFKVAALYCSTIAEQSPYIRPTYILFTRICMCINHRKIFHYAKQFQNSRNSGLIVRYSLLSNLFLIGIENKCPRRIAHWNIGFPIQVWEDWQMESVLWKQTARFAKVLPIISEFVQVIDTQEN